MTIDCPHCGKKTVLGVAGGGPTLKKSNKILWVALSLMLAVGGGVLVVIRTQKPTETVLARVAKVTEPPVVSLEKSNKPVSLSVPQPASAADTISDFDVSKISLQKMPGSSLVYAVGTLKNAVDRQRFGVRIELNQLDENDKNVGVISDYVSVVDAQKAWQFKAVLTSPHVAKVTVADIKEQQ